MAKIRKIIVIAALAAGTAFGGAALYAHGNASHTAPYEGASADPARVQSGVYHTDPAHTLIGWSINHLGFNDYFGQFGDAKGTLLLDKGNISNSSVDIRIPLQSVAVVSDALKEHLFRPGREGAKPDFFGPNPPDARFISTSVRQTGPDSAVINGRLSLNGATHPVTLNARFTGGGINPVNGANTLGFAASARINRSDYGLTYALPALGDAVTLTISAAFEQQSGGGLTNKPGANSAHNTVPPPKPEDLPCGANRVSQYIGQPASSETRSAIATASGADSIRWITPGMAVTQDYRPDRLNVMLDPKTNRITGFGCN